VNWTYQLLTATVASSIVHGLAISRVAWQWAAVVVGLGVLVICGRWWAHRRDRMPYSRSENEAMRRHVNKNYD